MTIDLAFGGNVPNNVDKSTNDISKLHSDYYAIESCYFWHFSIPPTTIISQSRDIVKN